MASSSGGKRSRDPEEEELCLDNFHSHKRYLSEIMASSLNGLTVEDSLTESIIESPSRDESTASPYSPMSEDSDEPRLTPDLAGSSRPTSPVSPHRHQRFTSACLLSPVNSCLHPTCLSSPTYNHPRQRVRSDSEGRFPSSPSDMSHTEDLRRAALLRSVQIRTQESEEHKTCLCATKSQSINHVSDFDEDKCFDDEFTTDGN